MWMRVAAAGGDLSEPVALVVAPSDSQMGFEGDHADF